MTPLIRHTASFKRDAADVWDFVGQDAPDRADRLLDDVDEALTMLARYPLSGRSRPELAPDVRSFPVGRFLVYYLPLGGGGVVALRLLHTSRDVEGLF